MRLKVKELSVPGVCWSNKNVFLDQWYEWHKRIIIGCVPYRNSHTAHLVPCLKLPIGSKSFKQLAIIVQAKFLEVQKDLN